MASYALPLIKMLAVSFYELNYSHLLNQTQLPSTNPDQHASLKKYFDIVEELHPEYFSVLDEYMKDAFMSPPAVMDADWKLVIVIHNYLSQASE